MRASKFVLSFAAAASVAAADDAAAAARLAHFHQRQRSSATSALSLAECKTDGRRQRDAGNG